MIGLHLESNTVDDRHGVFTTITYFLEKRGLNDTMRQIVCLRIVPWDSGFISPEPNIQYISFSSTTINESNVSGHEVYLNDS